jgi:uncharacterized protein YggU (UPF0235/DUF167 family)
MLHPMEASITVRVTPRSGRTEVTAGPAGVAVRVRAAPEDGRATAEATAALAAALGVPRSAIRLRSGARSRVKVFAVAGMAPGEPERRLHAL